MIIYTSGIQYGAGPAGIAANVVRKRALALPSWFCRPCVIVDVPEGAQVFVRCGRWRRYEHDEDTRGSKLTGKGPT